MHCPWAGNNNNRRARSGAPAGVVSIVSIVSAARQRRADTHTHDTAAACSRRRSTPRPRGHPNDQGVGASISGAPDHCGSLDPRRMQTPAAGSARARCCWAAVGSPRARKAAAKISASPRHFELCSPSPSAGVSALGCPIRGSNRSALINSIDSGKAPGEGYKASTAAPSCGGRGRGAASSPAAAAAPRAIQQQQP